MSLQKFRELLSSEDVTTASFVLLPVFDVFIGVIPYKISNESSVWDVGWLWDLVDLLKTMHVFAKSSVHAHDLFVNECNQWHVVETGIELLPKVNFVPSLDLVKESVDSCDCLALMVSSQDDHRFRITHLKGQQQAHHLTTLLAPVNVVTHEKVSCVFGKDVVVLLVFVLVCHFLEHIDEVTVLAMDVTEYLNWCFKLHKWLFVLKTLLSPFYEGLNHLNWKVNEGHTLWVLGPISDDIVVQIVNDRVHEEHGFLLQILFSDVTRAFFELLAPLFLDIQ